MTRHVALQEEAFKASAAYLGEGPDLLHRTPEDSRRFRALPRLNIVCFALRDSSNDQRDRFLEKLKEDGQVLLTPTFFDGKPAIRAAFVNWSTSEQDIPIILDALERCA